MFQMIDILNILPLRAEGNTSYIRSLSISFSGLPPVLSRTVGNLLTWTLVCIGNQREQMRLSHFDDAGRNEMAQRLAQMAKDLMVFAGLIRYKLPVGLFEELAGAGTDVGAY